MCPPAPSDQRLHADNKQQVSCTAKAGAGRNLTWKHDAPTFLSSDFIHQCISSSIPYFKIKSDQLQPHPTVAGLRVLIGNKVLQHLVIFFFNWEFPYHTFAVWESLDDHVQRFHSKAGCRLWWDARLTGPSAEAPIWPCLGTWGGEGLCPQNERSGQIPSDSETLKLTSLKARSIHFANNTDK